MALNMSNTHHHAMVSEKYGNLTLTNLCLLFFLIFFSESNFSVSILAWSVWLWWPRLWRPWPQWIWHRIWWRGWTLLWVLPAINSLVPWNSDFHFRNMIWKNTFLWLISTPLNGVHINHKNVFWKWFPPMIYWDYLNQRFLFFSF